MGGFLLLLLERSKVSLQIYNGVTGPRCLKTGRDNLFWGVDEGKQDPAQRLLQ